MKKIFLLGIICISPYTLKADILSGKRCDSDLLPVIGPGPAQSKCVIRVDGKIYKEFIYEKAGTCYCPPESELPPKAGVGPKGKSDVIVGPVTVVKDEPKTKEAPKKEVPLDDMKKSKYPNITAKVDGKKGQKIDFNCKSKMSELVDEDGDKTGIISCEYLDVKDDGASAVVADVRIEGDKKEVAKKCGCHKDMVIPLGALKPYGMSLLDGKSPDSSCKVLSISNAEETGGQFCLLLVDGVKQVFYDDSLNACENVCDNKTKVFKRACSVGPAPESYKPTKPAKGATGGGTGFGK